MVVSIALDTIRQIQAEDQWQEDLLAASPETRERMLSLREKVRKEAQEERRHQELCRAIRDSGKWF